MRISFSSSHDERFPSLQVGYEDGRKIGSICIPHSEIQYGTFNRPRTRTVRGTPALPSALGLGEISEMQM